MSLKKLLSSDKDDDNNIYRNDLIKHLKEEISSLNKQLANKDRHILFLVKNIAENTNILVPPTLSTGCVAMETKNITSDNDLNWHTVKHSLHSNHTRRNNSKSNVIPTQNRFNGLINEESSPLNDQFKMHDFNTQLSDCKAIKRSFSGCTTTRMKKYYVNEVLEEERPDTIILQIGGNDLSNTNTTEKDILNEIITIVNMCRNGGVNNMIVSAITARPAFQAKLDEVNRLLKANAGPHNYIFSENSNINSSHLWKDKVHLNNEGISLLALDYLDVLHNRPHFYDFY